MKRFLSICILLLLLFNCAGNDCQKQHSFMVEDKPTIEGIYQTPAVDYIGVWTFEQDCGEIHSDNGLHKANGRIEFKDNGQFVLEFFTHQNNTLIFEVHRFGYWLLSDDISYINMAVIYELNSKVEVILVDPKAALQLFFRTLPNNKNAGQYLDENQRQFNFQKKIQCSSKLERP